MEKLTDKSYWDGTYVRRRRPPLQATEALASRSERLILRALLDTAMENKRILEIGAGDSAWLTYLAARFPSSHFAGLDYSPRGCALLTDRARRANVSIDVVQEDMFAEQSALHGTFDIVISAGVVEHFSDLGHVLRVKRRYLAADGLLFTIIPNMAGILGTLTRAWNRPIYDAHVPHDWESFVQGHQRAGLEVVSGGYLGSTNFGVLSSCFPERRGIAWQLSRALVALSMAVWRIEDFVGSFPSSRTFSPYIYAISRPAR